MEATLQSLFRAEFESYSTHHGFSVDQYHAAQAIMACQSEALGYEHWECFNDHSPKKDIHFVCLVYFVRQAWAQRVGWVEARARVVVFGTAFPAPKPIIRGFAWMMGFSGSHAPARSP